MPLERLSAHFSMAEFCASEVAARNLIDNTMPETWVPSAVALCENVLEPARRALGPIRINSGYRCKKLNTLIAGANGSQHQFGQAADIIPLAPGVTTRELFLWIYKNAPFDQLINEFAFSWVHVSYTQKPRRNVIEAVAQIGKKRALYVGLTEAQVEAMVAS